LQQSVRIFNRWYETCDDNDQHRDDLGDRALDGFQDALQWRFPGQAGSSGVRLMAHRNQYDQGQHNHDPAVNAKARMFRRSGASGINTHGWIDFAEERNRMVLSGIGHSTPSGFAA
jgi:hypothetical protein